MEINAKDLRIGNYLQDEFGNIGYLIHWNSKNMVSVKKQFSTSTDHIENFKAVPITEQLLLEFGFYKKEHKSQLRYCHETLDVEIDKQGNNYAVVIWSEDAPHLTQYIMHCKYFHDFQNKIFALTNQELIKQ